MGVSRAAFCLSCISVTCESTAFFCARITTWTLDRNHASNVYMLHALGITHVVSVGECALVPPPHINTFSSSSSSSSQHPGTGRLILGKGPGYHGSLWIEEREGRIKVLDIQGVCDDGIDTLEPQLEPICAWIERARLEGGQVLVHCRVGVSRSATVAVRAFPLVVSIASCLWLKTCL
jgi:dual specificity MAP kinase phosphatase